MEWKNTITQLENWGNSFTSRMDEIEDRLLGLKDKGEELEHTANLPIETLKSQEPGAMNSKFKVAFW